MVITGDRTQIDLPRGVTSGLVEAERILKNLDHIAFSYFTAGDVVRHPIVAAIIKAYDKDTAKAQTRDKSKDKPARAQDQDG